MSEHLNSGAETHEPEHGEVHPSKDLPPLPTTLLLEGAQVLDSSDIPPKDEVVAQARQAVDQLFKDSDNQTPPLSPLERAQQLGFDEASLQKLIQGLYMDEKPFEQKIRLRSAIKSRGLTIDPAELLSIARNYQTEKIKATEKGPLLHYHQTSLDGFDSILDSGGLLSHKEQQSRGIGDGASGSRPDVVQFTRDHYDAQGVLTRPGLVRYGLGAASDVAFVFDDRLMDEPGYDSIVTYPNLPAAPIELAVCIVVTDEANMEHVRTSLADHHLNAEVVSRDEWLRRTGQVTETV
jgi:hypothetical protein